MVEIKPQFFFGFQIVENGKQTEDTLSCHFILIKQGGKKDTRIATGNSEVTLSARSPMLLPEQCGSFIWEFKTANSKKSTLYHSVSSLLLKCMGTQTAVFTHRRNTQVTGRPWTPRTY